MITRKCPPVDYIAKDVFDAYSFSQVVQFGDLYFFAGLAPVAGDLETFHLVGEGDMAAQLKYLLRVMDDLLAAEGLDRSNILSWTMYTTDMEALTAVMGDIVGPWVGDHCPGNTMLTVEGFVVPGQLIEITPIVGRT